MAILTESYTLTSDDGSETLTVKKDPFGNIKLSLWDGGGTVAITVSEEFASQFTYALNRLS